MRRVGSVGPACPSPGVVGSTGTPTFDRRGTPRRAPGGRSSPVRRRGSGRDRVRGRARGRPGRTRASGRSRRWVWGPARDDGIGVEVECRLRRSPGRWESGWGVGKLQVAENGAGGLGVGEESEDAHVGAALGAAEGEDLIDAGQELGPAGAGGGGAREGGGGVAVSVGRSLLVGGIGGLYVQPLASEGDHVGTEPQSSQRTRAKPWARMPQRR
jgi:hypothetical protein